MFLPIANVESCVELVDFIPQLPVISFASVLPLQLLRNFVFSTFTLILRDCSYFVATECVLKRKVTAAACIEGLCHLLTLLIAAIPLSFYRASH
jgi:hypothetical protein